MSDEQKTDEKVEEVVVKTEEVKVEKVEETNDDLFVTEDDTFDVDIKYYIEEKTPIIEGYDDEFSEDGKKLKAIKLVFKYPSQRDCEAIMASSDIVDFDSATYSDIVKTENVRLMTLIRSWTLDKPLGQLANFNPKVIKAIRLKISEVIGMSGIF